MLLALIGLALITPAVGQRPDDSAADYVKRLQKAIDGSLKVYEFTTPRDKKPLKLLPVLRWGNAARGSETGLTALWVGERPEAVVCAYPWDGKLIHEFSSLSRGTFTARRDGEIFWQPDEAGLTFRPVPDADPPAKSRIARLRQIKILAERFEATLLGWRADKTDRQELRRLPRPLHRYDKPETADGELIDGAVIAFVMGTDPEVLLLIEAVRTEDKTDDASGDASGADARWEYAFVRRTSGALAGRLDGQEVWTAPGFPNNKDPQGVNRSVGIPLADVLSQE